MSFGTMNRSRFATLALAALGFVLASFVILGFGRLLVPYRVARLLAAPTLLVAVALTVVVFAQSLLVATGRREFD